MKMISQYIHMFNETKKNFLHSLHVCSVMLIFHYKSFSYKTVLYTAWGGSAIKKTQMLRGNQTVQEIQQKEQKSRGEKRPRQKTKQS